MNSREDILNKLRAAPAPFPSVPPVTSYLPVTPLDGRDPLALQTRFISEAQALNCHIHLTPSESEAATIVLQLLDGDQRVAAWDFSRIPCLSLSGSLHEAGVTVVPFDDPDVRAGITGADAALAATGSLVMVSGPGRYRSTSLLPQLHIAIITADQILANMENWFAKQRQDNLQSFQASNINIISGPSRTADIAMELILGMHGPGALHIIIISKVG
jgi:L-lactate dehydrogenase complex protein LldG